MNSHGNRRWIARWVASIGVLAAGAGQAPAQAPQRYTDSAFVAVSKRLSEAPGFFDTDNLISNEDSYLHPVSTLKKLGVSGGTYVGVGPDQNFSYIAAIKPRAAIIIDIRRDNLVEHMLFKTIFSLSRNRMEYLALLFGKTAPADTAGWSAKPVDSLFAYLDRTKFDSAAAARIRARVMNSAARWSRLMTEQDLGNFSRFYDTFVAAGPGLKFNSFGRAPSPYYPDFRRLARELDRDGKQASFLATEANFAVVKDLEDRNLVIPVVGNFAGPTALADVAEWMVENHEHLSAFYTSNVEQYLHRDGGFNEFAKSVAKLTRNSSSVFIRSCFNCSGAHPHAVSGYRVVQIVQSANQFVSLFGSGKLGSYGALLTQGLVTP